jgi:hypothetical protein
MWMKLRWHARRAEPPESRGYVVALPASSSGMANKQEMFMGITCGVPGVVRGRRRQMGS